MTYEKDAVWATTPRPTQPYLFQEPPAPTVVSSVGAFGPEAHERAQDMAYERVRRIQEESPFAVTDVVEHVVHDQRLYVGMWIVAGVGAVASFLSFSLPCVLVTGVALFFALHSTPGLQKKG